MNQVTMGSMKLQNIKACFPGPACALPPVLNDGLDLGCCQGMGSAHLWKRNAGRSHKLITPGFASAVGNLDAHYRTMFFAQPYQLAEALHMPVIPDSQAVVAEPAPFFHCGSFYNNQAYAADGPGPVVHTMPISDIAVLSGRIHAHGGHHNPVGENNVLQFK